MKKISHTKFYKVMSVVFKKALSDQKIAFRLFLIVFELRLCDRMIVTIFVVGIMLELEKVR